MIAAVSIHLPFKDALKVRINDHVWCISVIVTIIKYF